MLSRKWFVLSAIVIFLILGCLVINVGDIQPAPHLDDLDSGTLLDSLYAILLASLVLFVASGLGRLLISSFKLSSWTFLERAILELPLGLAVIGYAEFGFGLVGWLKPIHQMILLAVFSIIAFKPGTVFIGEGLAELRSFPRTWRGFSRFMKLFFIIGCIALLLALLVCFTPPYDYDGLMYHLQGPRLFLEAGRIIPIPENWFTFYPAAWEMVYMLGMGLGSDIFARLIAFSTLLIFLLATYSFGKRFLPSPGGWLSAAMVMGVPMMLAWGGFAYIDLAWSLFQFLAVGLFLIWVESRSEKLLILAGMMQGLALGTKYSAFTGAAIIGLGILWFCLRTKNPNQTYFRRIVTPILKFGIPALLVSSPWYLKNWIWTGNPVFPFYFVQQMIDPAGLKITMEYLSSFGTGRSFLDYLLLPFTLFTKFDQFSTFTVFGDYPNPVFLCSFAYPMIRKKIKHNRILLDGLTIMTALFGVAWAFSSQQSRFLMPLFPGLGIITSAVILNLQVKGLRLNWSKIISIGLVGGMLICSLVLMVYYFELIKPYKVIFGSQSKSEFLSIFVNDFQANEFINTELPENALVFLPWDGRGYYCDGKCLPDIGQANWTALIQRTENTGEVSAWMQSKGITHLLISLGDIKFFTDRHDPNDNHQQALSFFLEEFLPHCTIEIYKDDETYLFELQLENVACQYEGVY